MLKVRQKKQINQFKFVQIYKFYDLRKIFVIFSGDHLFLYKKGGADDEISEIIIIIFICINTVILSGL